MINNINKFIQEKNLFKKDDKLILAISGGADSVCLMHILLALGYKFDLAHCNFNLRGNESENDASFIVQLSSKYKLKLHMKKFNTKRYSFNKKISVQMAARELRYNWFDKLLIDTNSKYIIMAHHMDDDIETFFINLLRGTGIKGLLGITIKNKKLVRPLINTSRSEIEAFMIKNNFIFRNDSSNKSIKYLRNKIRHKLLPLINQINPNIKQTIIQEKKYLQGTAIIYNQQIEYVRNKLIKYNNGLAKVDKNELLSLNPLNHYLFELLNPYGFFQCDKIALALRKNGTKQFYSLTHEILIDRKYLFIIKSNQDHDKYFHISINDLEIREPLSIIFSKTKQIKYNTKSNFAFLDLEKLVFPLKIRKWENGDRFIPLGMEGFKKLSDYFIDRKFSAYDKLNQWLLCSNDDIVWIIGHQIDDRYKLKFETKKVYIAEKLK